MEEYQELLNRIKKPTPPPYGNPWNPAYIFTLSFFIPFVAAGIGFALNWRRLGKPKWTLPTLLVSFLSILLLVVGFILGSPKFDFSSRLSVSLFALMFSIPTSFFIGVLYLQSVVYQKWRTSFNVDDLMNHQYSWRNGILVMITSIIVIVGFANWKFDPKTPHVYQGSQFSVEYDPFWESLDKKVCDLGCELVLGDAKFHYTTILFEQTKLNTGISSKGFYQSLWPQILEKYPKYEIVDQIDDFKIDGQSSVYVEYYEAHDDGKKQTYFGQYFVVVGQYGIVITAQSDIPGIYREDRTKIEQVINSIRFNNGSKPV